MRSVVLWLLFSVGLSTQALAWGQEGHSIVAEIAHRRLSPQAAAMVAKLLGRGHSLASIASWADDVRDERPGSYNWHFVDIPVAQDSYNEPVDCHPKDEKEKGDCTIAELERLRNDLRCASGAAKLDALKFAVHFIGDAHQPLHTVLEERGGNDIQVDVFMRGMTCTGTCQPTHGHSNFHSFWDSGLIMKTVWDWGAYVERLEQGWLKSPAAKGQDGGTPTEWINEAHKEAQAVWKLLPADKVLTDDYYNAALPVLDRQLGRAGLRLARFLNTAYASKTCPVRRSPERGRL